MECKYNVKRKQVVISKANKTNSTQICLDV